MAGFMAAISEPALSFRSMACSSRRGLLGSSRLRAIGSTRAGSTSFRWEGELRSKRFFRPAVAAALLVGLALGAVACESTADRDRVNQEDRLTKMLDERRYDD